MTNISFSATTEQVRQHRKHVTRRIDAHLRLSKMKPGDILQGIEKAQGLKKGEKIVKLDQIVILEVNREPLKDIALRPFREIPHHIRQCYFSPTCSGISLPEKTLEGFSEIVAWDFVKLFCKINKKCTPETEITRVLFDYQTPLNIKNLDNLIIEKDSK